MDKQHTLLIVDDNPVNLEMLSGFLKSAGFRVLVAEDGEAALEQASLARPDLVLMDVLLPGLSGFDSTRKLHRQRGTEETPVIFLTALSRTVDKIEGFRAGGVDYLTKPLQFEEVLARVRVHLQIQDLRAELLTRNRELDQRDQRRNQMLGIVGHDLSAPMASIAERLRELQKTDREDGYFTELLDSVAERAEQMNGFLARLLEWGKLQVLSESLAPEPFLLRDVVDRVLRLLEERMQRKAITVHANVPDDLEVSLNRSAVETILNNLIANAVKFSEAGASVDVQARTEDDSIVVTVTDRGVGMSKSELARLMESEDRLQRNGTAGETGSGLGLVLTKDLVSRMRGSITAQSEPASGRLFSWSSRTAENSDLATNLDISSWALIRFRAACGGPMKTCFFFPGQGAQFVGMGKDLHDRHSEARELFALASSQSGVDIPALVFDATEDEIKATDKSQIAITTVNLAARRVLETLGITSSGAAGFSLGEYSALVDAGVLDEATCLSLVWERGRIMETVSRSLDSADGAPGMIAVLGIGEETIRAALEGVDGIYPANLNSPVQTVLSGTSAGMAAAEPLLKEAGARRVIALKVSGPFHSPLMDDARVAFAEVLAGAAFSDPGKPVFSNVTGRAIESGEEARALCSDQLVKPVRWVDEEGLVAENGFERIFEVGPGEVLSGLWKAYVKSRPELEISCLPAGTADKIEEIEK